MYGSLIAIMLGRLRMPVSDCVYEYTNLLGELFGHPRRFNVLNSFGIVRRTKYDAARAERAYQSLVERRLELEARHSFDMDSDLCRV